MGKLKLRDLVSMDTMAFIAAIVLCVVLATDPSFMG